MSEVVTAFYQQQKRILSFCSGAFLLGKLGFLNGRNATTHWRYAEQFQAMFDQVNYVDNVLYIYDGYLGCSAGSTAGIDLGIEVIRHDFGRHIANKVARRLVMPAHRSGGQSQYVETPVPDANEAFSAALDWALSHLHQSMDINLFAQQANMSRRTFDRKFRAHLGQTPKDWLTRQRLNLVKELLEERPDSIERIAQLAGFESSATMRHHFRNFVGVSPQRYREQFNRSSRKVR